LGGKWNLQRELRKKKKKGKRWSRRQIFVVFHLELLGASGLLAQAAVEILPSKLCIALPRILVVGNVESPNFDYTNTINVLKPDTTNSTANSSNRQAQDIHLFAT
jgi:hypothetical protein